ncbi:MAG: hypothetical protein QXH87_04085 [Candidatus Bathyarchaeia archaeon]
MTTVSELVKKKTSPKARPPKKVKTEGKTPWYRWPTKNMAALTIIAMPGGTQDRRFPSKYPLKMSSSKIAALSEVRTNNINMCV